MGPRHCPSRQGRPRPYRCGCPTFRWPSPAASNSSRSATILNSDPAFAVVPWLVIAVLARQFLVVAENRRLAHSLSDRALRDLFTNLGNPVLFRDRLEHAVQLYHRDQRSVAVLSMDIDDFKLINDKLGQVAGDVLPDKAAQRLLGCVRSGDTVARLGGDEFAVLIEEPGRTRI